jgi:hypothetical protein
VQRHVQLVDLLLGRGSVTAGAEQAPRSHRRGHDGRECEHLARQLGMGIFERNSAQHQLAAGGLGDVVEGLHGPAERTLTDPPRMLRVMGIETTGKLHTIFDTKQVSERFSKREFVVELVDNPKYPQTVLFQLTGDRCAQLDDMRVGDEVRIEFSLRGREWRSPSGEVKYFNSLDVWKIEPARAGRSRSTGNSNGNGRGASSSDPRDGEMPPRIDESQFGRVETDDIPF